jgi:hypothetical protein
VRIRLFQAFAIVALLHAVTPLVDPTSIALDELSQHYGETVQLDGRVTAIDAHGDVLRFELTEGNRQATVLTRGSAPSLGEQVTVRGQPSPGEHGPIVWAEGAIETETSPEHRPLGQVLENAPRLRGQPIAVTGTWADDGAALLDEEGRLPVDASGIAPPPEPVVVWGRLVYEPDRAGYELEAQGWRGWTPPSP